MPRSTTRFRSWRQARAARARAHRLVARLCRLISPVCFGPRSISIPTAPRWRRIPGQLLSQVADKIKACPDAKIAVKGYTDNSGNDAINQPLSENRAKSVADFLVSQGVAAGNVTSQGFGSANPVAPNDTPEGKAQNRRVEIAVS